MTEHAMPARETQIQNRLLLMGVNDCQATEFDCGRCPEVFSDLLSLLDHANAHLRDKK